MLRLRAEEIEPPIQMCDALSRNMPAGLKKVILHRKNSLFYKTENGAGVGDLFMSLIHTCELGGFNPRDYFQQLVRHQSLLASNPAEWMPWNYRQTVASLSHPEPLPAAAVHET